jgi:hypothetical protein
MDSSNSALVLRRMQILHQLQWTGQSKWDVFYNFKHKRSGTSFK